MPVTLTRRRRQRWHFELCQPRRHSIELFVVLVLLLDSSWVVAFRPEKQKRTPASRNSSAVSAPLPQIANWFLGLALPASQTSQWDTKNGGFLVSHPRALQHRLRHVAAHGSRYEVERWGPWWHGGSAATNWHGRTTNSTKRGSHQKRRSKRMNHWREMPRRRYASHIWWGGFLEEPGGKQEQETQSKQQDKEQHHQQHQQQKPKTSNTSQSQTLPVWLQSMYRFYAILYSIALIVYIFMRVMECLRVQILRMFFTRVLKQISTFYGSRPRLMPMAAAACLFGLGDALAQKSTSYGGDWQASRSWNVHLTLGVAATSAVLHGGVLNELYSQLDARWGTPTDLSSGVGRVVVLQAVFLFVWLPILALVFGTVAGFLYRTTLDETMRCTAAAVAGIPWHLRSSLALHADHWRDTVVASSVFWPPSHAASYWFTQRWTPNFRTTWDGVVALLWNAYLLAATTRETSPPPAAVGPLLPAGGVTRGVIAAWPAFADCGAWSVAAMTASVQGYAALLARRAGEYGGAAWRRFYVGCVGVLRVVGAAWRVWHRLVAWLWCNGGYILAMTRYALCLAVLWLIVSARVTAYMGILILFKMLYCLCAGFDKVKGVLMLWFVPEFFPYTSCPHCPVWPPQGTWPRELVQSPQMSLQCSST